VVHRRVCWLDPNRNATRKGPTMPKGVAWRGVRGRRSRPDGRCRGRPHRYERARTTVSGKAPRPGGGSTTEAWPALLGCSCSLAVGRAQSRAIGSYD
jgi:hypothetical protein